MPKQKRKTMWVGGGKLYTVQGDASTAVGDVFELIPSIEVGVAPGQLSSYTVEAIYLHFSIRRLLITELQALGFLVWMGAAAEGGNSPVQALDALSTTVRSYSNKQIMMMAPLPVPPLLAAGDLATAIPNDLVLVAHHEYQASRKFDRSSQVLSMTINSDVDNVVSVFAQWRVLLEY